MAEFLMFCVTNGILLLLGYLYGYHEGRKGRRDG